MKLYQKSAEELKTRIVPPMGYCFASDMITVHGKKVGYMYREDTDNSQDSGWRVMEGTESDEYINNPNNSGIFDVNTIAHYDNDIIPFLDAPSGTAYIRDSNGKLQKDL